MSKLKFDKYIPGKKKNPAPKVQEPIKKEQEISEEIVSVIGLALSLHLQDVHDYERAIITMQKVMRPYSPWSSKIYGLREIPFKFPRRYK